MSYNIYNAIINYRWIDLMWHIVWMNEWFNVPNNMDEWMELFLKMTKGYILHFLGLKFWKKMLLLMSKIFNVIIIIQPLTTSRIPTSNLFENI
jgi:hypothetical protein